MTLYRCLLEVSTSSVPKSTKSQGRKTLTLPTKTIGTSLRWVGPVFDDV